MPKPQLDANKIHALYNANSEEVVAHVMTQAVELALRVKYGPGIIRRAQISDADVASMYEAFAPLRVSLAYEATMSHFRVFNGILSDSDLRNYFLKTTAGILGKTGGRARRERSEHLVWLENVMRLNEAQNKNKIPPLSAKEHFQMLKSRDDISGVDENGALSLPDSIADKLEAKGKEPVIGMHTLTRMLTKIRKTNKHN